MYVIRIILWCESIPGYCLFECCCMDVNSSHLAVQPDGQYCQLWKARCLFGKVGSQNPAAASFLGRSQFRLATFQSVDPDFPVLCEHWLLMTVGNCVQTQIMEVRYSSLHTETSCRALSCTNILQQKLLHRDDLHYLRTQEGNIHILYRVQEYILLFPGWEF